MGNGARARAVVGESSAEGGNCSAMLPWRGHTVRSIGAGLWAGGVVALGDLAATLPANGFDVCRFPPLPPLSRDSSAGEMVRARHGGGELRGQLWWQVVWLEDYRPSSRWEGVEFGIRLDASVVVHALHLIV